MKVIHQAVNRSLILDIVSHFAMLRVTAALDFTVYGSTNTLCSDLVNAHHNALAYLLPIHHTSHTHICNRPKHFTSYTLITASTYYH